MYSLAERNTRDAYDRAGERYDAESERFNLHVAYPELMELLEREGGMFKSSVLDVGCGSGRLIEALCAQGMNAQGLELSPIYVHRAKARGLSVACGSMSDLPFPNGSFDAVVSYYSLPYLPIEGQCKALREQRRVLRDGGVLIAATVWPPENEAGEMRLAMFGETFVLYPQSVSALEAACRTAGFKHIHVHVPSCPPLGIAELARSEDTGIRALAQRYAHVPYALYLIAK